MTDLKDKTNEAFKSFNDLKTTLKKFPSKPEPEWFEDLIFRVRNSPDRRTIAFKVLVEMALGKSPYTRLREIKEKFEDLFYDGQAVEVYTNDPELTRDRLEALFMSCVGARDLREFYSELHYQYALLPLIQAVNAPDLFGERLCLFSEVFVKHARRSRVKPSSKKRPILEVTPEDISNVLLSLVPNSGGQPKKLEDFLSVIEYLHSQWVSRVKDADILSQQNESLNFKRIEQEALIEEKQDEIINLTEIIAQKDKKISSLEAELTKSRDLLDSQQHLIGHHAETGKRDLYTRLSRRLKRHLENIKLFADRDQPNRSGIIEELDDIERYMSNFEEEL